MGMPQGWTDCEHIKEKERRNAIGEAWDAHVFKAFSHPLRAAALDGRVQMLEDFYLPSKAMALKIIADYAEVKGCKHVLHEPSPNLARALKNFDSPVKPVMARCAGCG
eukprot:11190992-Alexandrium_andersonii.AAC.1